MHNVESWNADKAPSTHITYGPLEIDLTRYVGISDYAIRTLANPENGSLHWIRWGFDGGAIVRLGGSNRNWTEENEEIVFEFGMRSFWFPTFHSRLDSFFFVSDNNNDESFNIYRFCPEMRAITQVTHVGYAVGYAFRPDSSKLAFLGRPNKTGEATSLFELDLDSPDSVTAHYTDDEAFRIFPYSHPVIDVAGERIAFVLKQDNRRSRKNLAIFSKSTGQVDIVTDANVGRNALHPLGWMDDRLLLINDEGTEKQSLYEYNAANGRWSTIIDNPLRTASGVYDPATQRVLLEFRDGNVGELCLVEGTSGEVIARERNSKFALIWSMCHSIGSGGFVVSSKIRGEREVLLCHLDCAVPPDEEILTIGFEPSINKRQAEPCKMEHITYPTFDLDEQGDVRQIEAVLFMPRQISGDPQRRSAIVWAHGGPSSRTTTTWHANIQLLTAMGYIVLGANPRGSIGQGKQFEDLNNEDWGGGDYLDYEHGLRYLMNRFKIPHRRIGMAGFSFGGYMTNWAVTRPNGLFGFGISIAGMSDLRISIDESVVATNTISEMGDIDEDEMLYHERSPINWAAHMDVPLLLIHGARDQRTSTNQSRVFYKMLRKLQKDVQLVEIPGEGHGFRALKSHRASFQHQADFLRRVAPLD